MGFLKKAATGLATGGISTALDALKGSYGKAPGYDQDASALTGQYGVQSDLGNMSIVKNADGTYSKSYTSSANDIARNNLISQGLGALTLDPTQVQQAYYDQATRLLNNQFDQQRRTADTNLINRGIQTGTEQYNQVMGDLQDRQNSTLQDIANQAVYMGDQNIGQKIGNINSLSGARDVLALSGMGGGNNAYDSAYNAQQYQYNTKANTLNNLLGLGATAAGAALFSDKNLKENLKKVGALTNGLNVYVGNYKKETGLTMSKYFRFPEGRYSENALSVINELGYKTIFWSFGYADWDDKKQPDAEKSKSKILENTHNGAVILLHPNSATNAKILPELISKWKAMGYEFGTLDELTSKGSRKV